MCLCYQISLDVISTFSDLVKSIRPKFFSMWTFIIIISISTVVECEKWKRKKYWKWKRWEFSIFLVNLQSVTSRCCVGENIFLPYLKSHFPVETIRDGKLISWKWEAFWHSRNVHECLSECRSKLKILKALFYRERIRACSNERIFSWCYVKYYKTFFSLFESWFLAIFSWRMALIYWKFSNCRIKMRDCNLLATQKLLDDDVFFSEHNERRMKSEQGQFYTVLTTSQETLII